MLGAGSPWRWTDKFARWAVEVAVPPRRAFRLGVRLVGVAVVALGVVCSVRMADRGAPGGDDPEGRQSMSRSSGATRGNYGADSSVELEIGAKAEFATLSTLFVRPDLYPPPTTILWLSASTSTLSVASEMKYSEWVFEHLTPGKYFLSAPGFVLMSHYGPAEKLPIIVSGERSRASVQILPNINRFQGRLNCPGPASGATLTFLGHPLRTVLGYAESDDLGQFDVTLPMFSEVLVRARSEGCVICARCRAGAFCDVQAQPSTRTLELQGPALTAAITGTVLIRDDTWPCGGREVEFSLPEGSRSLVLSTDLPVGFHEVVATDGLFEYRGRTNATTNQVTLQRMPELDYAHLYVRVEGFVQPDEPGQASLQLVELLSDEKQYSKEISSDAVAAFPRIVPGRYVAIPRVSGCSHGALVDVGPGASATLTLRLGSGSPYRSPWFGCRFDGQARLGGRLLVADLHPDGLFAKLGLAAGDEIVEINARPSSEVAQDPQCIEDFSGELRILLKNGRRVRWRDPSF